MTRTVLHLKYIFIKIVILVLIISIFLTDVSQPGAAPDSSAMLRSGSIAVVNDGSVLIVVNSDSDSISLVNPILRTIIAEVLVGPNPQALSIGPQGRRIFVTNRADDTVSVVDLGEQHVVATIPVGDEPFGVIAGQDGRVYVSNTGSDSVWVFQSNTFELLAVISTEPHPRGLALSKDGQRLYVTHFFSGELSIVDTQNLIVKHVISTGSDSNLSQSVLLDASEQFAYLPQTRSNVTNPALLFDSTVFPIVSVVDLSSNQNLFRKRIALDVADRPVGIPIDVALVSSKNELYVLNAGSNDISVIDLNTGFGIAHIEVRDNPRGVVLSPDEKWAYVNNTLSGTISIISTESHEVVDVRVTEIPLDEDVLNGKILFNSSARIELSKDRWISCATCHFDGEMDGRTWFFPDGPRNTPSLLGVRETLPIHWSGDLDELQDVEITVRNIQLGTGLAEGSSHCDPACDRAPPNAGRSQELDNLVAFMISLNLPPNPNLNADGALTIMAERGKIIFFSQNTGCSTCHISPLYTDLQKHDVGTGFNPLEVKSTAFDTPSLRGIYKTAPYLHDGSAPTLNEVITTKNPMNEHGVTSHLTEQELKDLIEYLRSLPYDPK